MSLNSERCGDLESILYSTAPKRSCIPSGNQTWPMENHLQVEISSWETHLWGCVRCRLIVGLFPDALEVSIASISSLRNVSAYLFWGDDNPYLVGNIPIPLKNMSSSLGMMKFPTEWKVIKIPWFQTTNQINSNDF